jgi:hypothetical protein
MFLITFSSGIYVFCSLNKIYLIKVFNIEKKFSKENYFYLVIRVQEIKTIIKPAAISKFIETKSENLS